MGAAEFFQTSFENFKNTLTSPVSAARKIFRNASLGGGFWLLAGFLFLAGFIFFVLDAVGNVLGSFASWAVTGNMNTIIDAVILSLLIVLGYFIAFIPVFIMAFITLLVWVGVIWAICKFVFGGKAEFGKHLGVIAYPIAAVALVAATLWGVLAIITKLIAPFSAMVSGWLSILFALPMLLLALYWLYLEFVFTGEVHGIEMWKAGVAVMVPSFFAAVILGVIAVILAAIFFSVSLLAGFV